MTVCPRWIVGCVWLATIAWGVQTVQAVDEVARSLAARLEQGRLAEAEQELRQRLADQPQHQQARFALGVVQVLQAIEQLGQQQYRYGALSTVSNSIPVLRLPIPTNPEPAEVTYQQVREVFQSFQTGLLLAEAELAKIDLAQEVKLPLDVASIRIDLSGDGRIQPEESFLNVLNAANRSRTQPAPGMQIMLDNGDVPWLRGYCHFLAGFCDFVLAYDHQRLFDHCGHLVYPRHVTSEALDLQALASPNRDLYTHIADIIAAIHLVDLPLKHPERMEAARQHFLAMIRTSRESWELILKETDNDREWLPNPAQTGVLQIPVTRPMIDGWHAVLREMADVLEGRKLIPFWRDYFLPWMGGGSAQKIPERGRGVNLKRFFLEPRQFDLVLLLQGTAALPYLEEGELSHPETWRSFRNIFQGQFFGFAMWFN